MIKLGTNGPVSILIGRNDSERWTSVNLLGRNICLILTWKINGSVRQIEGAVRAELPACQQGLAIYQWKRFTMVALETKKGVSSTGSFQLSTTLTYKYYRGTFPTSRTDHLMSNGRHQEPLWYPRLSDAAEEDCAVMSIINPARQACHGCAYSKHYTRRGSKHGQISTEHRLTEP